MVTSTMNDLLRYQASRFFFFSVWIGVYTALIEDIGVQGVQVEELCTLDERQFVNLLPIHGLLFLYKYESNHDKDATPSVVADDNDELFLPSK